MSPLPQGGLRMLPGVTTEAAQDAADEIVLGIERTGGTYERPLL